MNIPTPKTATGLAIERLVALAVVAALGALLGNWNLGVAGKWGLVYFVLKTAYDFLVKDIPNT